MKHVVILGAGFAGIAAALVLEKQQKVLKYRVTLIDRNPYHLFTPSLYEVATSEEPQGNIAIPLKEFFNNRIHIITDMVETIDSTKQQIHLSNNQTVPYDFLVITLGSIPAFMHIPGLQEHCIPLKTLADAVKIKEKIRTLCCEEGKCNRKVELVIGGGGFSGTELAAEMLTYKNRIAKQNHLSPDCLNITIIQGSSALLKELDKKVSDIAQKRLSNPNVTLAFGGHIKEVTDKQVLTDDGKLYPYTIFIWTGGVEANHTLKNSGFSITKRGEVEVMETLQVKGFQNIFAGGDNASYIDPKTQQPVPWLAQTAESEGKIIGENIIRLIKNQPLKSFRYHHLGYIVPLRGRYAVAQLICGIILTGFFGWVFQQVTFFYYLLHILPVFKAWKKWNRFEIDLNMIYQ